MSSPVVQPFLTVVGIEAADWDALGQVVLVQALAGPPGSPGRPLVLALTPEAAESMRLLLNACEPGKAPEAGSAQ